MCFMQTESVLQTKTPSEPAKNRFSVALKCSILGLCEVRWKKSGEIPTDGGHRVYFSGKEDKHEQGVGFLVHKDIVKSVIGCRPIASNDVTICKLF